MYIYIYMYVWWVPLPWRRENFTKQILLEPLGKMVIDLYIGKDRSTEQQQERTNTQNNSNIEKIRNT